jgi:hypothetical protein
LKRVMALIRNSHVVSTFYLVLTFDNKTQLV